MHMNLLYFMHNIIKSTSSVYTYKILTHLLSHILYTHIYLVAVHTYLYFIYILPITYTPIYTYTPYSLSSQRCARAHHRFSQRYGEV